ncbi:TAF6-like RNA polymerase II p300/CBP-associated factor-associated factor 65 kDa subunit 6L [Latimeria chalumnae]|uniref:TAF6-like RNA polymerase II p300/CBP-associated factor-associated factor 65 kDa subunit 6L n=1 Tax=Latimeria chalumnae TaxID=7897 RepID=H3AHG8_LATCH|nr:PREDICTED: TAF6-like RNA polymerase II p300/CBP-associated factor-associated factor 65 kDa subunit 6L [Latimeria chalumnae]|eukprot:XP_005988875.1 PREDICTED: TAF6-like RNA polymerase II p300/CBP-associated factor-associated factor 65 kDa subunit 6L [Latimeria chalumnae]
MVIAWQKWSCRLKEKKEWREEAESGICKEDHMPVSKMSEREERKFAEIPRESVKLMAESVGVELTDEVAAMLAEDVCYRLREASQNSSQFMKHARRRKLTVEDLNRALRWSNVEAVCGYGAQDSLPFRSIKEGELYFVEDREINLVELALATNIPKGCAETTVRVKVLYLDGKGNLESQGSVPGAVSTLSDDLLKYYQHVTRAVLGDDPHLMKVALRDLQTNSKIAAVLPYFVYVVSGVKSVSYDLEQLNRLLRIVQSLIRNPFLYLGSYVKSLISSVMYCVLEPLAASINPLNDHWTLRDYAAMLLSDIFWTHGDLVSGLYHQILLSLQKVLVDPVRPLCSHYGAVVGLHALGWRAVERVLYPHLSAYWSNLQAVLDDYSVSNAQVKADGHKVYGAILVAVEKLLKMKARSRSDVLNDSCTAMRSRESSPGLSPLQDPQMEFGFRISSHLLQGVSSGLAASAGISAEVPVVPLAEMYRELYDFFGDSLAIRFGTGSRLQSQGKQSGDPKILELKKEPVSYGAMDPVRKMPQLTVSSTVSPRDEESPKAELPAARSAFQRPASVQRSKSGSRQGHRTGVREVFQKSRFCPRVPHVSFVIAGRQMGRRCKGRLFQTTFPQYHGPSHASRYAQKLPMIGRVNKPVTRWVCADYSLYFPF